MSTVISLYGGLAVCVGACGSERAMERRERERVSDVGVENLTKMLYVRLTLLAQGVACY